MEYELYHHGILGMHWGIRRYQNKDGTLTAAGKNRYGPDANKERDDSSDEEKFYKSIAAQKDKLYSDARDNGKFETTFVEAIQNDYDDSDMTEEQINSNVLNRYDRYLDNPRYWLHANREYYGLTADKAADKIVDNLIKDFGSYKQIDDPELYELALLEYGSDLELAGFDSESVIEIVNKRFAQTELKHHGILGMKWGIRRYQNKDGSLTEEGRKRYFNSDGSLTKAGQKHYARVERKDIKWATKNYGKIEKKAFKASKKEIKYYQRRLNYDPYSDKGRRKMNEFNQMLATIMTKNASNIKSPSGRAVKFVAKRGELGVMMALADEGYDMSQLKNGVWSSGRIAYKKKTVDINR